MSSIATFATPRRKFIIADTPGHLVHPQHGDRRYRRPCGHPGDARQGLVEQSRRHTFLVSLLRVPHIVLCVNKMDLVDWSQDVFEEISFEFEGFAARLAVPDLAVIPVSALHGDNVVDQSANMPWYEGPSLLSHLEQVHITSDRNLVDVRFPVQYVIRPQSAACPDYRGYAGKVAGGVLKPGDEVMVLPSGYTTRIAGIDTADGPVAEAYPPRSVTLRLEDDLDISRGDMICRPANQPTGTQDLEAIVCWMDEQRWLSAGAKYALKHTTRSVRALVKQLHYRIDINTLHREENADHLGLNDIGRIQLRTTQPVLADPYSRNRQTGGFILIDETTNRTAVAPAPCWTAASAPEPGPR
jgi:bifunctional enzyme CysN/CysC